MFAVVTVNVALPLVPAVRVPLCAPTETVLSGGIGSVRGDSVHPGRVQVNVITPALSTVGGVVTTPSSQSCPSSGITTVLMSLQRVHGDTASPGSVHVGGVITVSYSCKSSGIGCDSSAPQPCRKQVNVMIPLAVQVGGNVTTPSFQSQSSLYMGCVSVCAATRAHTRISTPSSWHVAGVSTDHAPQSQPSSSM